MDWIEFGSRFGIPVLMLLAISWFGVKKVWPFVTKQVDDSKVAIQSANSELTQQRKDFLMALREQTERLADEIHNRDESLLKTLNRYDETLQNHTKIFSESLTRRDAAQARTADTLEMIYNSIERIERRA